MQWWAPGAEDGLTNLAQRFGAASWPLLPEPFEPVGAPRPMRVVARAPAHDSLPALFVKWSRPVTAWDRLRRRLLGGRGAREGRLLRALSERGVAVPRVFGWTDEGVDLLLTEEVVGLDALPPAAHASPDTVERVARLMARAWRAGLRLRDVHAGNLGLAEGRPVLVDVGGGVLRRSDGTVRALARARHGLLGDASARQRIRALHAWLTELGEKPSRAARRDLVERIERRARLVTRRYRRGRDRRATRTGRHYEVFRLDADARGVASADRGSVSRVLSAAWLESDPVGATSLKGDGRVVRFPWPGGECDAVLKRYGSTGSLRVPRSIRAFRLAVAMEHRCVAAPTPLLAVADARGSGYLVSAHVDAPDLHRLLTTDGSAALRGDERRDLAASLGRFLRAMHDGEISHRDLKAPNLLVLARDTGGGPRILIADVDGARRRVVSWARRARDLGRLDASVAASRTDRLRVFRAYWRAGPRPPHSRRRFLRSVAHFVTRKRGPANLPR